MFTPQMLADPYPAYHKLRAAAPVHWLPQLDAWLVTTHDAVSASLRNPQLSSDRAGRVKQRLAVKGLDSLIEDRMVSMLHKDPPDHTRLRGLVNKAFTPRTVEALGPGIKALISQLLDAVASKGRMEVIEDLACPLPVTVIADMLGVPAEDRMRFKGWSDDISAVLSGDVAMLPEPVLRRVIDARNELADYFRAIVTRRRSAPGKDLLSALIAAEEGGGKLTEDELYSTAVLLLIAGNETTTNLIGNGLWALLKHPNQMKRVWADAALVNPCVEEMLRYDGPVQLTSRLAKVDLSINGMPIKAGHTVLLVLGAANRDPAAFAEPDRFDAGRADNKHVAFGAGPHFCLGAPLARLESQLVLHALRERFPGGLRLEGEAPAYRNNFNLRGLKALNVAW